MLLILPRLPRNLVIKVRESVVGERENVTSRNVNKARVCKEQQESMIRLQKTWEARNEKGWTGMKRIKEL